VSPLLVLFALALSSEPEPPRDNPHFDSAVAAWKDERWADAAAAFARAYEIDPRPEYVFARAQALRFSGDCARAIDGYRDFIALDPPRGAIDEAREHIATCGGDPEASPPAEPSPDRAAEPVASAPQPAPGPEVTPSRERQAPNAARRWWRDPTGHVLGWTGLAAAAVGTGFLVEGLARRERGERATDEQSYRDARRGGASLLHAGIPLVAVGGALVLGAVIRFAVIARAEHRGARRHARSSGRARPPARVRMAAMPSGLGIAWSP
jgi:tetratricopeptide (TPR) repeat protein